MSDYQEDRVIRFVHTVAEHAGIDATDSRMPVWAARLSWDARDLGWDRAEAKHLDQLRREGVITTTATPQPPSGQRGAEDG